MPSLVSPEAGTTQGSVWREGTGSPCRRTHLQAYGVGWTQQDMPEGISRTVRNSHPEQAVKHLVVTVQSTSRLQAGPLSQTSPLAHPVR